MRGENYVLRFFFDAGSGICLWAGNALARQNFDYPIDLEALPLSEDLIVRGQELIREYDQSIDWDNPPGPTPWGAEQCRVFNQQVEKFVTDLRTQLGESFTILDEFCSFDK